METRVVLAVEGVRFSFCHRGRTFFFMSGYSRACLYVLCTSAEEV